MILKNTYQYCINFIIKLKNLLMKHKQYNLSQTCQIKGLENIYKLFLGYKKNGYFIEFGAYDGEYVSNTSGLADLGWKGLYIEPVKEYYEKCKERHKTNNVKVINCAVGDVEKKIEITIGGPLSSISKETVQRFKKMNWSKNSFKKNLKQTVMQYPLNKLLEENSVPQQFDILSIDVEGYEWKAIKNFNINKWKPKIIIIELHDNNKNYKHEWDDAKKIRELFNSAGYYVIYKDFSNTIFIRNDLSQIK